MDIKETNTRVIEQFRAGGEIDGMRRDRVLLLTTIGRGSRQPHTTPMMFHRVGGQLIVIASNNGAVRNPDWYLNLTAHPEVTVEIGDRTYPAEAVTVAGGERERLWASVTESYPFFTDHQAQVEREIPLVVLTER